MKLMFQCRSSYNGYILINSKRSFCFNIKSPMNRHCFSETYISRCHSLKLTAQSSGNFMRQAESGESSDNCIAAAAEAYDFVQQELQQFLSTPNPAEA